MTEVSKPIVQASNVSYELHSLGWRSFQDLCSIIMQEIWGHSVQSFCDTHDGGRDGAFYGSWKDGDQALSGSFTAQCKFTVNADKSITLSDLTDEFEKAERLAAKGLAKIYVLFTNAKLSGKKDELLKEKFESIDGLDHFIAFGKDRISLEIQQSSRLRMLVPRVYGLGDLSLIMDERACGQASAILSALGDDLSKFVRTDVFHRSAKALVDHGFVLLLGEPACGKSTIAAALALGAIDEWGCTTIKITDSSEFIKHWNPNDPKRLYWIDDAFGATQFDYSLTVGWNRAFPQIHAAIQQGAKILFTSRDYIFHTAKSYIKESAFPVVKTSQVVINVQEITTSEREQILYNHIKLGDQNIDFKKRIKPFLKDVATNSLFTPEIARRLGNSTFTQKLIISSSGTTNYVENPLEFLLDVITTIDRDHLSALALIFMRDGVLDSPITVTVDEEKAIEMIGGTAAGVRSALNAMNNSLVVQPMEDNQYVWRYKHPTIRDAFAQYVSDNIELLDIYLTGAPLNTLIREVSCGVAGINGVKIIIPRNKYAEFITRINTLDRSLWRERIAFNNFMSERCDHTFIKQFISADEEFTSSLSISCSFFLGSDTRIVLTLARYGLLSDQDRSRFLEQISNNAINEYDPEFLGDDLKEFLTDDEFNEIRGKVAEEVILNLEDVIVNISDNFDPEGESAEDCFDNFRSAIRSYQLEFVDYEEELALADADEMIESEIFELRKRSHPAKDDGWSSLSSHTSQSKSIVTSRSIFDDVDL